MKIGKMLLAVPVLAVLAIAGDFTWSTSRPQTTEDLQNWMAKMSHGVALLSEAQFTAYVGARYLATDYDDDIDIADPKFWSLSVPTNDVVNVTLDIRTSATALVQVWESGIVTNGTVLVPVNLNRSSTNTATLSPTYDAGHGTPYGTAIVNVLVGPDLPGKLSVVLAGATCTNYLFKVTALTDNTAGTLWLEWYEE